MKISPVDMESRKNIKLSSGDTVRVHQRIKEKEKTRIQIFEGVVIAIKHGTEAGSTFTVRRVGSDSIAVEKIYPLYSPMIDKIEVIRRTKTRRAKLYYLRDKTQKQIRDKLRRTNIVSESTTSESQNEKDMAKQKAAQEEAEMKKEEVVQEENAEMKKDEVETPKVEVETKEDKETETPKAEEVEVKEEKEEESKETEKESS